MLYLEGPTDLAILQAFAKELGHAASGHLERSFVHYVANNPELARSHFHGLRESKADLVGFALFDRLEKNLQENPQLPERMWARKEIENYLALPEVLLSFAEGEAVERSLGEIFEAGERARWRSAMEACITDVVPPAALRDPQHRFWRETKATDDFLDPLMEQFAQRMGIPNLMRKSDYHVLARHVPGSRIDPEVVQVLDAIVESAIKARPVDK